MGPGARPLWILSCILLCAGCELEREGALGPGQHAPGWNAPESPAFHGRWLRENGDPLGPCRTCHGEDYGGGPVGSGCIAGCHESGPEACGTCHGAGDDPLPGSGAHGAHGSLCESCHVLPTDVEIAGHLGTDDVAEVVFRGLAVVGGAVPVWDPGSGRCSGTYCHAQASPSWAAGEAPGCDGCHGAPPASHARFAPVATLARCGDCHPTPGDARHLDGVLQVQVPERCDHCHGQGELGAPAPALDGSTEPTARGVGAHRRHLDPTLPDRIAQAVPCETCHSVPDGVLDASHLDDAAPADVILPDGEYDPATGTCLTSCHFDRAPGPSWTDASGDARACDGCHAFPPETARDGDRHPVVEANLDACLVCHVFDAAHHVNGELD